MTSLPQALADLEADVRGVLEALLPPGILRRLPHRVSVSDLEVLATMQTDAGEELTRSGDALRALGRAERHLEEVRDRFRAVLEEALEGLLVALTSDLLDEELPEELTYRSLEALLLLDTDPKLEPVRAAARGLEALLAEWGELEPRDLRAAFLSAQSEYYRSLLDTCTCDAWGLSGCPVHSRPLRDLASPWVSESAVRVELNRRYAAVDWTPLMQRIESGTTTAFDAQMMRTFLGIADNPEGSSHD